MEPDRDTGAAEQAPKPKHRWLKRLLLVLGGALLLLGLPLLAQICVARHREAEFLRHVAELREKLEASLPAVPDSENAAQLYEEAFRLYVEASGDYGFSGPQDLNKPDLKRHLAENGPCLAAMAKAVARPSCRFPMARAEDLDRYEESWNRRGGASMLLVMMVPRHAAYSGDSREAIRVWTMSLRLARDLGNSGLNGRMLLTNSEGAVTHCLRRLEAGSLSEEELATAVVRMWGEHLAERANMVQAATEYKLLFLPTVPARLSWRDALAGKDVPLGQRPELAWLKLSGTLADLGWATEGAMDARIALLDKPYPAALDALDALEKQDEVRLEAGKLALAKTWAWKITLMADEDAGGLAAARACMFGFGCRLFRLKTGAYPETLAELAAKLPEHFKELPADPFTGKPFLYRRTASGCLIWSVGSDRADDGGDPKKDFVFELKK